jgi:hypothetical protein
MLPSLFRFADGLKQVCFGSDHRSASRSLRLLRHGAPAGIDGRIEVGAAF